MEDSKTFISGEIPPDCKQKDCWLGIDEAGRGPVLGPMVYGTCFSPLDSKDELCKLGFADSKVLKEEERSKLFDVIKESSHLVGYMVEVLSAEYISNCMLSYVKYNLNEISHDTAIRLIQKALDEGVQLKEVYVDTVGDPTKYQDKLKNIFPNLDITVAKKADSLYAIVSAASICAKVTRDDIVDNWVFREGQVSQPEGGHGSGYPGDPVTKEFLQTSIDPVFGFPNLVRFSWSTARKILEQKAVSMEWEEEGDEDEDHAKGMMAISSYFQPQKITKKRSRFFRNSALSVTQNI